MKSILKVAIQGDRASFHEIAAHQYYQQPVRLAYCASFEEVFKQLAHGNVDKAFVAVENSVHGSISEVYALLSAHSVSIESYHSLRIEQHLIGLPSASLVEIDEVLSHPVALSQCDIYLSVFRQRYHHDTSAAVEYVKKQGDQTLAAVASEAAAKLHGMKILRRSIQNDSDNTTIFASISLVENIFGREEARSQVDECAT
jgi:prephenate dehydratase